MSGAVAPLHSVRSGPQQRPPVVFLHGFLGSRTDWADVLRGVGDAFDAIAVDLPGHGSQAHPEESSRYSIPGAAAAVIATLDALGLASAHIVGYSMGGRLALYLAVHHPSRCRSVIMESASPGLMVPRQAEARRRADEAWAQRFENEPLEQVLRDWYAQPIFSTLTEQPELYEKMMQQRRLNRGTEVAKSMRGMSVGAQEPLWDRLPNLDGDVWVLTGQRDVKYGRIAAEMVARSPRIRAVSIPDAGHNGHLERPGEFNRIIGDILSPEE